jgi:acetyl-CoA C-acetyltransferase
MSSAALRTPLGRLPLSARQTCFRSSRQFSSSTSRAKEIQDAYILSAVRTPVGVVCVLQNYRDRGLV